MSDEAHENQGHDVPSLVHSVFERIESRYAERDAPPGLPTGFYDLDHVLGGLREGDLIAICGRPSMAKSSLAENITANVLKDGGSVLVFSLAISSDRYMQRLLVANAQIDSHRLEAGYLAEQDWARLTNAIGEISNTKLFVYDAAKNVVNDVRSAVDEVRASLDGKPPSLIVIDYLQLISGAAKWNVEEAVIELKRLARELSIPVLVISTMPGGLEKRIDKRPMLADLGDNDAVAIHADVVLLTYREDFYNPQSERPAILQVDVAKSRSGPVGWFELYFEKSIGKLQTVVARPFAAPTGVDGS